MSIHFQECFLCAEQYTDPKILKCGHSFCNGCLTTWVKDKQVFKCPTCRTNIILSDEGVSGLPSNVALAQITEEFLHNRNVEPPSLSSNQEMLFPSLQGLNTCRLHTGRPLQFYCTTCCQPICSKGYKDIHRGHCRVSVEETTEDLSKPHHYSITAENPTQNVSDEETTEDLSRPNEYSIAREKPTQNVMKNIRLERGPGGFGFFIAGGKGCTEGDFPIFIKTITPFGAAARDGRLKSGDQILAVNGCSLKSATQEKAANILRHAQGITQLTILSRGSGRK